MRIKKWAKRVASLIERHFSCHGIKVKLRLHSVLRECQRLVFQVIPMPGTKIGGIRERAVDVQAALQIPLFQPFKDRDGVRIFLAVSQKPVSENSLWKMLTSQAFRNSKAAFPVALGYDLMERMVFVDLEKMPHAMYAGATRSGKSFGLICLIMSLICKHSVNEVNLVIFDIGASTLDVLESIPHLSHTIVKIRDEGIHVIQSLMKEMERRIGLSSAELCNLPTIVCVMDEYTSFIGSIDSGQPRQKVADNISDLLRRGRKGKIHMVLATQDPTNKTMGVEVGNITSRMAFKVARFQTSIAILNCAGAEKLPGSGAMLYQSEEYPDPIYIQGANISTEEIEQLTVHIIAANQDLSNKFVIPEFVPPEAASIVDILPDGIQDDYGNQQELSKIILWALGRNIISGDKIKQTFSMGNRAKKFMDKLLEYGLISGKDHNKPRCVLPQSVEDIPNEVMKLLRQQGISVEDVVAALNKRNSGNSSVMESRSNDDANY